MFKDKIISSSIFICKRKKMIYPRFLCTCYFEFIFKLNEIRKIQRKEPEYYKYFSIALNDWLNLFVKPHLTFILNKRKIHRQHRQICRLLGRFVLVYNYHSFRSSIKIDVGPNEMCQLCIAHSPISNSSIYNVWMSCWIFYIP